MLQTARNLFVLWPGAEGASEETCHPDGVIVCWPGYMRNIPVL